MNFSSEYVAVAEELSRRIEALITDHPEILTIRSCWDLFKVPGFDCKDLGPSMAQAQAALEQAKDRYAARTRVN